MTSTDAPSSPRTRPLGLDEVAALEEERDHLLGSLDDLEREHDAGDLDDVDYASLKDDYTTRAADVIRALDAHRELVREQRGRMRPRTVVAITAAVLLVAAGAGVLLARSSGQRGEGTLTGNDGSLREQLATCQTLSFKTPAKGIPCYQKILDTTPDNLDALTYQGWAYIRADQVERGAKNLARAVQIDPDYPDARVFRAVVLARAAEAAMKSGDAATARQSFTAAAAEVDRFYRNDPPDVAVQVLEQEGLERTIFFGMVDEATLSCWQQAAAASPEGQSIDQAFLDRLGGCLDGALAEDPGSTDAQLSKALSLIGPQHQDLPQALAIVDRMIAADPKDANALLLRASLEMSQERWDEAQRDLDAVAALPRPTASFLIGSPDQLRQALQDERRAATSTTAPTTTVAPGAAPSSTWVGTTTIPGAPRIPNVGGG